MEVAWVELTDSRIKSHSYMWFQNQSKSSGGSTNKSKFGGSTKSAPHTGKVFRIQTTCILNFLYYFCDEVSNLSLKSVDLRNQWQGKL